MEPDRTRESANDLHYFIGPLNIDRRTRRADTVTGAVLALSEEEFDSLDALAAREGESLSFDYIYETVWINGSRSFDKAAAKSGLDHLARIVGEAGEGFMWIENDPESGYAFRTRWSHNWNGKPDGGQ